MKASEFQDLVLQHLGEQKAEHAEITRRMCEMETQQKITNGTVRKHELWISNVSGKMAVIVGIISFGATALWQIIKDKFIS